MFEHSISFQNYFRLVKTTYGMLNRKPCGNRKSNSLERVYGYQQLNQQHQCLDLMCNVMPWNHYSNFQ